MSHRRSSRRTTCRVYIGGLPPETKLSDVKQFFHRYVRRCDILLKRGFGFIEFDDFRDADEAVDRLDGEKLLGHRVSVEHARGPKRLDETRDRRKAWVEKYGAPKRTEFRLKIKNLSMRVNWQDLKDLMRKVGNVSYAMAHQSVAREGEVDFESKADMDKAIEKYDGYEIYGRKMKVRKASSRDSPKNTRRRSEDREKDSRSKRSSSKMSGDRSDKPTKKKSTSK